MQPYPCKVALYQVSVRWVRCLPLTSFRFRVTTDTLVSLAGRFPLLGLVRDLHPLDNTHASQTKSPASRTRTGQNERRKWYLLELNQGHMDFQSIALPPELRYPLSSLRIAALSASFLICECKGSTFYSNQQTFPQKNARVSKKRCNFASVFKWGTLLGDLSID